MIDTGNHRGSNCEVYGEVHDSVIGSGVVIEEGAIVRDSIIMGSSRIGAGTIGRQVYYC